MPAPDRVIVVGGGVAGLVAARELALAGREVLLLEREERLGGQLRAHSVAGVDLDAGPEEYGARGDALAGLLTALGLDGEVVQARDLSSLLHRADGVSVPLPASSLGGIPGVPLASDVIAAVGMRAALRAQLDNLLPGLVAAKAETLAELVTRRMGRSVWEGLVVPVLSATHPDPVEQLPAEAVAPGLRGLMVSSGSLSAAVRVRHERRAGTASLRGGLHRLIGALAGELERFGVEVRTGVEVVEADATAVTTADGERLPGVVVLATGPRADVSRADIRFVTLAFDAPELMDASYSMNVYVDAAAPTVAARALTHLTAKWPWLAERSPLQFVRLGFRDAEASTERAHRDAEVLLGTRLPQPVDAATVVWARPRPEGAAKHAVDGMIRIGEAGSGTELAAAVASARSVVAAITMVDGRSAR